jgi:hypothetical protein
LLYYGSHANYDNKYGRRSCPLTPCNRVTTGLLWLAAATFIYLVFALAAETSSDWSPAARIAVTLAPLLPGIFYLRALLKSFWQMDELQRRIQIEALGFALAGTVIVLTAVNVFAAEGIELVELSERSRHRRSLYDDVHPWSVGVSISTFRYR